MSDSPPAPPERPVVSSAASAATAPVLTRLRTIPARVQLMALGALLVAGVALPGVAGGIILALLTFVLVAIMVIAWPLACREERLLRIAVVAMVAAIALVKLFPR